MPLEGASLKHENGRDAILVIRFRDKSALRLKMESQAERVAWVNAMRTAVGLAARPGSPTNGSDFSGVSASGVSSPNIGATPALRHSHSRVSFKAHSAGMSGEGLPSPTRSIGSDNTEFTSISSSLMPQTQPGDFMALGPMVTPEARTHRSALAKNRCAANSCHRCSSLQLRIEFENCLETHE